MCKILLGEINVWEKTGRKAKKAGAGMVGETQVGERAKEGCVETA